MVVTDSRKVPKFGYSLLCCVPPYTCNPMMANTIMNRRMRLAIARKDAADDSNTWVILRKLCSIMCQALSTVQTELLMAWLKQ